MSDRQFEGTVMMVLGLSLYATTLTLLMAHGSTRSDDATAGWVMLAGFLLFVFGVRRGDT